MLMHAKISVYVQLMVAHASHNKQTVFLCHAGPPCYTAISELHEGSMW